jgi:hypothetical protein
VIDVGREPSEEDSDEQGDDSLHATPLGAEIMLQQVSDFDSLRDYPPFQELMRPKG